MSLLQQIKRDQLAARKNKQRVQASVLTTLIGEASIIGKNDGNRESTDAEVVAVVKKFIKGIDESLSYSASEQLLTEKTVLEQYLPVELSHEQLTELVVAYTSTNSNHNMGQVMKYFKETYPGQYDGKTLSSIVKQHI